MIPPTWLINLCYDFISRIYMKWNEYMELFVMRCVTKCMGGPQESHEAMVADMLSPVHIKEQINNLILFILAFKNIGCFVSSLISILSYISNKYLTYISIINWKKYEMNYHTKLANHYLKHSLQILRTITKLNKLKTLMWCTLVFNFIYPLTESGQNILN